MMFLELDVKTTPMIRMLIDRIFSQKVSIMFTLGIFGSRVFESKKLG